MEKEYKEIVFITGCSIENALQDLAKFKEKGQLGYGIFNAHKLYSDIDDLESAYKKITGKTKYEFDALYKSENDRYKDEERKHKEAVPELTKEWIEKGNNILDEKYRELWSKCVPIRLGDLYKGMELKCCLDIVKELNAGCDLEKAKEIINNQSHSGMSYSLVRLMVKTFCNRGNEFYTYLI